jgi:hypothetical protein
MEHFVLKHLSHVTTQLFKRTSDILVSGFHAGRNLQMTDNSITVLFPHLSLQRNKFIWFAEWRAFRTVRVKAVVGSIYFFQIDGTREEFRRML